MVGWWLEVCTGRGMRLVTGAVGEGSKAENGIVYGLNRDTHHVRCRKSPQLGIGKVDERS